MPHITLIQVFIWFVRAIESPISLLLISYSFLLFHCLMNMFAVHYRMLIALQIEMVIQDPLRDYVQDTEMCW